MATVNSARSNFRDVIAMAEAGTSRLIALANVQVNIYQPGTLNPANVYGSRNPADTVPLAQPITTDATGIVNFWAEPGEYDIAFHDTIVPARIADQTRGWSALSPVDKGIPSAKIRDDNAMPWLAHDSVSMRQFAPLGAVIDWWRPVSTYDAGAGPGNPPPGFAICDGATVQAANHDFGTGAAIVLPDLRNKFVLGADITKADGAATALASHNDAVSTAPGIRGAGGSNRHTLASLESGVNSNGGTNTDGAHDHLYQGQAYAPGGGGSITYMQPGTTFDSTFNWTTDSWRSTHGHGFSARTADQSHNNAPQYVGLLKIMKIKRS